MFATLMYVTLYRFVQNKRGSIEAVYMPGLFSDGTKFKKIKDRT